MRGKLILMVTRSTTGSGWGRAVHLLARLLLLVEGNLTVRSVLEVLGKACLLIVLQVVHLDLPDVSISDSVAAGSHGLRLQLLLVNVLLAWIGDKISHSEHLSLVGSVA